MTEAISEKPAYRPVLAIFFFMAIIICAGGYRFYTVQRDAAQLELTNDLQAIAELKADEIVAWRQERLNDARVIAADRRLLLSVRSLITGRASSGKRQEVLRWMENFRTVHQYANATLVAPDGKEVLHIGHLYGASAHFAKIVEEVRAKRTAILRDLHTETEGTYHLGLNVPLQLPGASGIFGMLSFAVDPEQHLFPMVSRWPGPSREGETLLVRRDGAEALYLGGQDSRPGGGPQTSVALSKSNAAMIQALKEEHGLIRWKDREGRQVAAAFRAVPGSQWLILAQVQLEAIDKPIRDRALPISFAVVSLILAAGMTSAHLLRLQQRRHDEVRRGAELERQALATHYNVLSRSANDAILLMDQAGHIVEANDRALAMYGYTREELLGMEAKALIAETCRESFEKFWQRVDQEASALFEIVHRRSDGSTLPVEVSSLAIMVEGREYHQSIIRDITQRNLATKQLENANRLYAVLSHCNQVILHAADMQELFDRVCDTSVQEGGFPLAMVVRVDRETGDVVPVAAAGTAQAYATGIHLSARPDQFGQGATGASIRSGRANVIDDIEHDPQMSPWRERAIQLGLHSAVSAPIKHRGQVEFAFVMYSREVAFFNDREVKLIEEVAANISYALGRLDEEAGRRSAEEALRISEERYRQLVESAPVGMYIHRGGIVRYMNAQCLNLIGFHSLDEVAGTSIYEFIHPDDHELVRERVRTLNAGGAIPLIEERFLRTDGSTVPVEVSAVQILFDGEESTFVFCIDATQRKKAEEERARMEEQFLQAQKMESIGRLAGGVAHEFNNNLTVINGYCDLLMSSLTGDDPVRKEIAQIRKAGGQAATLTRELLTFSRRQVFSPQRVNLNDLAAEVSSMLGRLFGEQSTIQTRFSPELPCVVADPAQLRQVLMNLLINAKDAMPGGGNIAIETNRIHMGEERAARTVGARPGEFVKLTVSDTGVGMDAETKRHIFEPFFTTKPRSSGTGLGLSTVYGIVQQSNGWVEVESTPGAGTSFQIYLPAVTCGAEPAAEISTKAMQGQETILLVEDQSDVRLLTVTILKGAGYSVLEADSGAKALEISARWQQEIDLLLTDVVMPGMTGPELVKRLRASRPSIKVLFVSGYAEGEELTAGGAERGYALLSKPFKPSALEAKVREILQS